MNIKQIKSSYKFEKKMQKKTYKKEKKRLKKEYKTKREALKDRYLIDVAESFESRGKRAPINPPRLPVLEEIGNSVTHGVGALFSVAAFILMLINSNNSLQTVASVMYFFGLFVLFTMSCLYHAFPYGSRVKRLFRRFDYSSIYLLIGATFSPIILCYVKGTFGLVFFIVQWAIIITGITFISIFGPTRLGLFHTVMYIILGWCGVIFFPQMFSDTPGFAAYILAGGIVYSLGIIPFAIKGNVSHFIWHFFVLAGAVIHWVGIFKYIYLI